MLHVKQIQQIAAKNLTNLGLFPKGGRGVPFSQILNENGQNICLHFFKNKNDPCML